MPSPWPDALALLGGPGLAERGLLAALTAFLVVLLGAPAVIRRLAALRAGQVVRHDGPQTHLRKAGTPTMGGILIVGAVVIASVLWSPITPDVLVLLGALVLFGAIGLLDDLFKLLRRHSRGIGARRKFLLQGLVALLALLALEAAGRAGLPRLLLPFAGPGGRLDPGWLALPLAWTVVVGTSNAVNLTDGLDGQAALQVLLVTAALALIVALGGAGLAAVPSLGRLAAADAAHGTVVTAAAVIGACAGFLWYNGPPAQVFMGDVGALALGAFLGLLAVESGTDLFLLLTGALLVAETLSVVAQVVSYKTTGRRVLRMAPLHHHYELGGWPETKVVVRFALVTFALVLLGLLGSGL